MNLLNKLPQWFESKPLVLLRFEDGYESALQETRHGLGRFTVVKRHGAFNELKLPSLCLAEDEVDGFRFRDLDRSEFGFHSNCKVASFGRPVKPASRFQPMRVR